MAIAPSDSRGTNSEPRFGAIMPNATNSTQAAKPITSILCCIENRRIGAWMRWASRISSGSRSSILRGKNQARQHRHQRQRQDHRADQGEDHRQGHRPEQLAFDPFERQDRQVDDHDDQLAEHRRLADFDGRVADDVDHRAPADCRRAAMCRTQFSTITTELSTIMPKSMAPRLSRLAAMPNRSMPAKANSIDSGIASGHDQRRPQIAQEGEQHGDDQQPPFEQVLAHRVDHVIDQLGAVVDGLDFDVGRQRRLDLVEPCSSSPG